MRVSRIVRGMTLIEYRQTNGLTQADVAHGIDTGVTAVSQYEHGRVPKLTVMRRIIAFTGGRVMPNDFHASASDV